jgi:catechol 2,3-dioxygenase-like lactoylglutathione lyase family enzyme
MSKRARWIGVAVALMLVHSAFAQTGSAPAAAVTPGSDTPHIVGIAFVGRTVSDLDRSVRFYTALGFKQDMRANPEWRTDEVTERVYGVPKGTQTRMAKMLMNSNSSGKDFAVYLREFKGIEQKNVSDHTPWTPGAPHFGLVVPDAESLWARLKETGQLHARSWGGELIAPPGQTKKMLAYVTDPDGLDIEIIDQRPATPAQDGRPARPAMTPGISHVGIVILDATKARAFYEQLFGGTLVNAGQPWLQGDFYDSAVGGHGNILRFFNESFPEAADPNARLNFEMVEFQNRKEPVKTYTIHDVSTSYVGFEVNDLDGFLKRAKAAGATLASDGIATMRSGTRLVIVRDPDVGGFVELYQHPKK